MRMAVFFILTKELNDVFLSRTLFINFGHRYELINIVSRTIRILISNLR